MVVNDNAGDLDKRGALESIASKLAPTVLAWARSFVGAGLPAMVVNDNACNLDKRGALESIASRLAPTGSRDWVKAPVLSSGIGYLRRHHWHVRVVPAEPIGFAGFWRLAFAVVGIHAHDRPVRP